MSPRVNPKALSILVVNEEIYRSAPVQRFVEKGHSVHYMNVELSMSDVDDDFKCDVVIGPKCWRIDPQLKLGQDATVEESLERQLEMMERGIRSIKYPKVKDEPK